MRLKFRAEVSACRLTRRDRIDANLGIGGGLGFRPVIHDLSERSEFARIRDRRQAAMFVVGIFQHHVIGSVKTWWYGDWQAFVEDPAGIIMRPAEGVRDRIGGVGMSRQP